MFIVPQRDMTFGHTHSNLEKLRAFKQQQAEVMDRWRSRDPLPQMCTHTPVWTWIKGSLAELQAPACWRVIKNDLQASQQAYLGM